MAFIAVNAKADVEGSKKGRLTPAQNAVINAFSLSKQTGILDFGDDEDKFVANVTSTNMDSHLAVVTFSDGFFVVQGRLVQCEDGTTVTVELPTSGERDGNIVARFSPSLAGNAEFQVIAKTGDLTQDNLHTEQTGVYEFSLCSYEATPTGLTLSMNEDYIKSAEADLTRIEGNGQDFNGVKPNLPTNAPLNGYRREKGSVETRLTVIGAQIATLNHSMASAETSINSLSARLTNMGFKQGSISGLSGATLKKVGNYAILTIPPIYWRESGEKIYTMKFTDGAQFISNETLELEGTTEPSGYPFRVKLSQGSNQLTIGSVMNTTNNKMQIGFEIKL